MTLDQLEPGRCARVTCWCDGISDRFMEMGLLPGTEVEVVRVAPLGDPIAVKVKNCQIAIRRADATQINIEAS
ncbi:MAG: ferrous iron transport protein A [Rhodothermaceae bacterium]|nr:ferrous iron transport protein A [Rhodothermaceae bacterium]